MDLLRQQLLILQERLRGLTPSQKLLAGALVVIMMMTMLYWGRFASTGETVLLFKGSADPTELAAVTEALTRSGISYTSVGSNVRVPADRQEDAIAAITTAATMSGAKGSDALEAMLDKFSPLATQNEFNARLKNVRDRGLAGTIQGWPGVESARVLITESVRGTLTPAPAGASIDISTRGDVNPRKLAKTAVALVVPTVPYLTPAGVSVSVNGVAVITAGGNLDTGGFDTGDLMETQRQYQVAIEQAIREVYTISGLKVSVTADVSSESRHEKIMTPDRQNTVSVPTESTSEKTTTTDAAPPAEPGAVPNMGLDANASTNSGRGGSKTERTEERFENRIGETIAEVRTPAGKAKIVSAIVRVPRSYFIKSWKAWHKGAEPTDDELAESTKTALDKMRAELLAKTMLTEPGVLVVNDYPDFENTDDLMIASAATAAAPGSISLMASSHGKEAAIGALALTSLFMVGRMVKKSAPPATLPLLALDDMPDVSSKGRKIGASMEVAGEVTEGGPIMMGQELDEEVLETSQMVEQVSGFVKDNPDATAQLLKRWMNRE